MKTVLYWIAVAFIVLIGLAIRSIRSELRVRGMKHNRTWHDTYMKEYTR